MKAAQKRQEQIERMDQVDDAQTYYLSTPSQYRRMGGASEMGPYSSSSECESVNQSYFHGYGYCH
jgi:hypothetical protein